LEYGNKTRRYLVTRQNLDVLSELEFENGDSLYQERELVHLEDVKVVIQGLLRVFYGAVAVMIGGGIISNRDRGRNDFWVAVNRGGRLTAVLLLTVLFFTLISFRALFTSFHLIFFEGDSWLFNFSDTLIRLFPIRFWQDVFLVFGLITLAGSGILGWGIPALRKVLAERSGSHS
jgi:integral membrane protein (TIGR01906 family)